MQRLKRKWGHKSEHSIWQWTHNSPLVRLYAVLATCGIWSTLAILLWAVVDERPASIWLGSPELAALAYAASTWLVLTAVILGLDYSRVGLLGALWHNVTELTVALFVFLPAAWVANHSAPWLVSYAVFVVEVVVVFRMSTDVSDRATAAIVIGDLMHYPFILALGIATFTVPLLYGWLLASAITHHVYDISCYRFFVLRTPSLLAQWWLIPTQCLAVLTVAAFILESTENIQLFPLVLCLNACTFLLIPPMIRYDRTERPLVHGGA